MELWRSGDPPRVSRPPSCRKPLVQFTLPPDLVQYGLSAFVTLLVVVDPLGGAPIFDAMTQDRQSPVRQLILNQAITTALSVALFFLVAGRALLSYLGVSVDAFGISGGILLFLTALPMLFGHRAGLQAPESAEHTTTGENIAIFPLAIPLLCGPGTIATVLLLTNQAGADPWRLIILTVAIVLVFAITWVVLRTGQMLLARLGEGKMHIVTRVMGILLAALAVQFVLNGITGFFHTLAIH